MPRSPTAPGSVIGAAVTMLIYGGLLLLCVVCSGAFMAIKTPDQQAVEAMLDKEAPGHSIISIASLALNFLFGVVFIAAGVGVWRLMPIARLIAYLASVGIILETIALQVYNLVMVMPLTERLVMQQMQQQGPAPFDMGMVMKSSMAVGFLIGISIPLAFCLPIMILLSTKSARAAFRGELPAQRPDTWQPPDDGYDDDDYNAPRGKPKPPPDTGITDRS